MVDKVLDCTANKGTGKMTVKQGADQGVACPTMASALDQRFISFLKDDREAASSILTGPTEVPQVDREQLLKDVRDALYAAKICSYAQGMMLIQEASKTYEWDIDLGTCARIWKGGCIIRAGFLDKITQVSFFDNCYCVVFCWQQNTDNSFFFYFFVLCPHLFFFSFNIKFICLFFFFFFLGI